MRNLRLDTSKHLYLNDLRLGRPADDERCGRVGSEDVGSRRLPALSYLLLAHILTWQSTALPLASDTLYAVPFTGSLTGQVTGRARGLYTLTEN